ncbi:MAG TPA: hypothetical protein DIS66_07865 [Candidatus Omnitrophica bacterium]|nr:hypothetical protein [Candidatus Omnitrophota bacterium]
MNSEQKDKFYAGLMLGMIRVFKHVPLEVTGHIFDFAGRCAYFFLPKKRRDGYWSMRLALAGQLSEDQRRNELRAQFRHLARVLGEVLTFKKFNPEEVLRTIQASNWDRLTNATKGGRGAVLLTAHYGNWELMQIYSGIRGQPVFALGRNQRFPRLNEILARQRELHGSTMVSRGMSMRALFKTLKEAGYAGILGDESAGRDGGVLLPFFGKVTSVPTGAFELARRTNSVIVPCFMLRTHGDQHHFYVEEALPETGNSESEIIQNQMNIYLRYLEEYIRRSPRQWLWQNKRWKYSWTRTIIILSDKKPGHFKQSQAVASLMSELDEYHGRKGLTFETKTVEIDYLSPVHAKLLFIFGWLLLPFIRGRMGLLRFFIKKDSLDVLDKTHADFIFAAGSSLAPLQHLFAAETGAKRIVMMTPPFPYSLLNYDLAVIPAHDQGRLIRNSFKTRISSSGYGAQDFTKEAAQFAAEVQGSGAPEFGVFVGGQTRGFDVTGDDAQKLLSILNRAAAKIGGYVLTTSRRTSAEAVKVLMAQAETPELCRRRIDAREDTRSVVAKGMLGLAKRMIVTEDSLAMISEAVATGKPVIVVRINSAQLPQKHRAFLETLEKEKWLTCVELDNLEKALSQPVASAAAEFVQKEKEALKEAFKKLL